MEEQKGVQVTEVRTSAPRQRDAKETAEEQRVRGKAQVMFMFATKIQRSEAFHEANVGSRNTQSVVLFLSWDVRHIVGAARNRHNQDARKVHETAHIFSEYA